MPSLRLASCAAVLAVAVSAQAPSTLWLPASLGDHMVVQQSSTLTVRGRAAPGQTVAVSASFLSAPVQTTAAADGSFAVAVATPEADGARAHDIRVECAGEVRRIGDVLLGEVWLCGGQSNMEWTLGPGVGSGIADWQREVADCDLPRVRLLDVPRRAAPSACDDADVTWRVCTPDSARTFSAIGVLFGRSLHRLRGVPVGLISCNWGGTRVEPWIAPAAAARFPELSAQRARVAEFGDVPQQTTEQVQEQWWRHLDATDDGSRGNWQQPSVSDGAWRDAHLPGPWDATLPDFDGVVWYRRTVDVPASWHGRDLVVELGAVDDMDTTWWNGVRIGGLMQDGQWNVARRYEVAGEHVHGPALLAVRAVDTGGAGGFAGPAAAMRVYPRGAEGEARSLAGPWRMRPGAAMRGLGAWPRRAPALSPQLAGVLFDGMVEPIRHLPIRGALFYQGEANVGEPIAYRTLFPAMIDSWRDAFGIGPFPFLYVQIAPFAYPGDRGPLSAFLREAQGLAMQTVPKAGMAVIMDVGNPRDIHPSRKQPVADRLLRWARALAYGEADVVCRGPSLRAFAVGAGAVRLTLADAAGLTTQDGAEPTCFTIAGADRVFHPARAVIEGEDVVVSSDQVPAPVAVRYAFGVADETNLVNGAGLPAGPFRTDDWPPPGR